MAVRMLATDKTKFALLTTQPANEQAPTASELNAGIDISLLVSKDGFSFTSGDPETINEPPLGSASNSPIPTLANYTAGFILWRQFLAGGGFDATADAAFAAVTAALKNGTPVWLYARKTDKKATDAWASGDELYLGQRVLVSAIKSTETTGYIKYEVATLSQDGWPFITVGGTAGVPVLVSASPSAQTAGKSLLVKGVRFTGTTAASVGGTAATNFTVVDDTTLLLTMPSGSAGSAPLIVTNANGASSSFAYTRGA